MLSSLESSKEILCPVSEEVHGMAEGFGKISGRGDRGLEDAGDQE